MGRTLIILVVAITLLFGTLSLQINRHSLNAMERTWLHYQHTKARNVATSGAYMALSSLSLDDTWTTGYTNLTLDGATVDVVVDDENSNPGLSSMERMITSTGEFEGESKEVQVHVGIPPDLADLAVYSTGPLINVSVKNESGIPDLSLAFTNMPFMLPYDFDGLESLAVAQGHVHTGDYDVPDHYPNDSFYYDGLTPNVTKVTGNMHVRGGRTVWGIFVVYGDAILDGNARVEGVITLPNPGTLLMDGGGDPKKSSLVGGTFANGNIDGTGNHISIRYDSEYMGVFAQWQLQRNLFIISWIESPRQ